MTGPPVGQAKNVLGALLQFPPRSKEEHWIEIALHRALMSDRVEPSSSGMRQSSPMTSAPVSDIEGSKVALSVPK